MKCKALIISIKGTKLSKKERVLISREKPWGVILFKRNLKTVNQIKKLTSTIKSITKNNNFPILIDEEGQNVSRLRNIINHNINSESFGKIFKDNKDFCKSVYKHYIFSISKILKELGININTIPVLDVLRTKTNKVIGNRSFSQNPKIVRELGDLTVKYLHFNKILGIIKHIPGHGAATQDSHKVLPLVSLNRKRLNKVDWHPFRSSKAKLAMTAHILYSKIDKKNPATFSKKIISSLIRNNLKFRGIIISDDISMKALKYDLIKNAKKSLEAGCNLVLYCSGNIHDNYKLIKSLPYIDKFTEKKTSQLFKFLR